MPSLQTRKLDADKEQPVPGGVPWERWGWGRYFIWFAEKWRSE